MLDLPTVTLCCVDTRSAPQALEAIRRSARSARFGRMIFFGSQADAASQAGHCVPGLEWRDIPPIKSIRDYNRFMLHELRHHVETEHVLVVQWDGFISNPELWRDDFLAWDYIGAPWYHGGHPGMVGNGGFSLRSKRLLDALNSVQTNTDAPEDMEICVYQRGTLESEFGVRIAPLSVAQDFACEYGAYRRTFGFHGMHNFAHALSSSELDTWLDNAPEEILVHDHARKLVKELINQDRPVEARRLLDRRRQFLGVTLDDWDLRARTYVAQLRSIA